MRTEGRTLHLAVDDEDIPELRVHELKCWPAPFMAIWIGAKMAEKRKNDRGFEVGDILCLRAWDPVREEYGLEGENGYSHISARVTHVQQSVGLRRGWVMLSIAVILRYMERERLPAGHYETVNPGLF